MPNKEKLLIIIALSLAGVSLTASIVLGLQVIKLKQDLANQSFPSPILPTTPTLTEELIPNPPSISQTTSISCQTDADCPEIACAHGCPIEGPCPPCPKNRCINGKCQEVYPNYSELLNKKIQLALGQTVNIKNTTLSLTLLRITLSQENCYACPVDTEVRVKNDIRSENIIFHTPGIATKELGPHRIKEIFGFRIILDAVHLESVILNVQKL